MLMIILLFVLVIFAIRFCHVSKHEAEIAKIDYLLSINEYNDLLNNLKKLTPAQMDKLINDFEEWSKSRNKEVL